MKGIRQVKALALAAAFSALTVSAPSAEETLHHGLKVDAEGSSADCLSCHNGVKAKPVMLSVTVGNYFCSHPINRDYPPINGMDEYKPTEQVVAAGIKFLNGQITCISCHDLKNPVAPHLAVPLDSSDLCFACHKI
jgi:predicted CXXCH cytochrome family protein